MRIMCECSICESLVRQFSARLRPVGYSVKPSARHHRATAWCGTNSKSGVEMGELDAESSGWPLETSVSLSPDRPAADSAVLWQQIKPGHATPPEVADAQPG
jgi:hypothetical protein